MFPKCYFTLQKSFNTIKKDQDLTLEEPVTEETKFPTIENCIKHIRSLTDLEK